MKPAKHLACGGAFTPDPDIPADHNGLLTCRCGLVGEPGDAHHTVPDVPVDACQLAAGESEES